MPGEPVKLYGTAEEGGYSIQTIPISMSDVIIKFEQTSFGVLYSRQKYMNITDAENLFGIMLPMPVIEDNSNAWKRLR